MLTIYFYLAERFTHSDKLTLMVADRYFSIDPLDWINLKIENQPGLNVDNSRVENMSHWKIIKSSGKITPTHNFLKNESKTFGQKKFYKQAI